MAEPAPLRVLIFSAIVDAEDAYVFTQEAAEVSAANLNLDVPVETLTKWDAQIIEVGNRTPDFDPAFWDIIVFLLSDASMNDEHFFHSYDQILTNIPETLKDKLILVATGPEVARRTSKTFFGFSVLAKENFSNNRSFLNAAAGSIWNYVIKAGIILNESASTTMWKLPEELETAFAESDVTPSPRILRCLQNTILETENRGGDPLSVFLDVISYKSDSEEDVDHAAWLIRKIRHEYDEDDNPIASLTRFVRSANRQNPDDGASE